MVTPMAPTVRFMLAFGVRLRKGVHFLLTCSEQWAELLCLLLGKRGSVIAPSQAKCGGETRAEFA